MKHLATCFLFLSILASAQIGSKIKQNTGLAGIWQNNDFGYQMTLMLNTDGSGEFDGDAIKYTTQGDKLALTIVAQSQTTNYTYVLNGNTLTMSGGDLEKPVAFARAGSQTEETPAPASPTKSANSATATTPSANATDKELIGTWSGNNESMEFRTDGKCMYNNTPIDYQVSQGHIILSTAQGQAMMAYKITGNQMVLTVNGAQYTYSKGAAAAASTPSTPPAGRNVPQELAGKW